MSKGYFSHNVFERIDACNRTTIYFKEDQVIKTKENSFSNYSVSFFFYSVN